MAIWLIRHGATEWSQSGQHTGRTDIPLLEEGERQARVVGQWLRARVSDPALVLTSPLRRAADTCRLAGYADVAEDCRDLAEWDYGDFEGRRTDEIRTEVPDWTVWSAGVPNGERAAEVGRRVDRVIERVRATDGDVLLFSHGHTLRVLAARWVGLPPAGGRLLALDAAAVSELGWERETPVIARWNIDVVDPGDVVDVADRGDVVGADSAEAAGER